MIQPFVRETVIRFTAVLDGQSALDARRRLGTRRGPGGTSAPPTWADMGAARSAARPRASTQPVRRLDAPSIPQSGATMRRLAFTAA